MKFNKDRNWFTIPFTFLVTVAMVFPLTLAYRATKPIADRYWLQQHYAKTLRSLGLSVEGSDASTIVKRYHELKKFKVVDATTHPITVAPATDEEIDQAIVTSATGRIPVYFYMTDEGGQRRFAGTFTGPGLWGNISLDVGVNEDGNKIQGLQVLFQVETPGLGGRIGETWFTGQFAGLVPGKGLVFNQRGHKQADGIDGITGATISSTAVKNIVNNLALPSLRDLIAETGRNN